MEDTSTLVDLSALQTGGAFHPQAPREGPSQALLSTGVSEGSTISSPALTIARADGVYLWDTAGKRYLDLFSQTWSMPLGHNHPSVIRAATEQLQRITHLRTAYATEEKYELAELLLAHAPSGLSKISFTLCGSLAVEGAMKLAINAADGRHQIIYLEDGFHGRSLATMGVSWKLPASKYDRYFHHGIEAAKSLKDVADKIITHKPAALILELVQGNCGFKILDRDFVRGVRALCDEHKVTMIVDEIQTAFGCVDEMFLSTDYGVTPDILVFGKAVGGGFPLAGIMYRSGYGFEAGEHSFTFGHSPVSFAAAVAFIHELRHVARRATVVHQIIAEGLLQLRQRFAQISEVRSIGSKGALDICLETYAASCEGASWVVDRMLERGIIVAASRYRKLGNTVMLQSPLLATREELEGAFHQLEEVLAELPANFPHTTART